MHDVFISYSSKDITQAENVRNILEQNGIPCWMAPRDIPGGSNYTKEIPVAIRGCQVFVLILSQNAQNSHWVLKEVDAAVNNSKVIIPYMIEDIELNDEFNFLLTGAQRYFAYQNEPEALENLISRAKAVTQKGTDTVGDSEDKTTANQADTKVVHSVHRRAICCPACGSTKVDELVDKTGVFSASELLWQVLVPILAWIIGWVFTFLVALVANMFKLGDGAEGPIVLISFLVGSIAGGIWAKRFVRERIRRRRVRAHLGVYPVCCNECKKKFLPS